jgi:Domain of unknown function (DUF5130)
VTGVVPVPAGEAFSTRQREEIARAIRLAEREGGPRFSVYVGGLGNDPRAQAERLHAALGGDAPFAVLVAVDPGARRLEIVTGAEARRRLDDRSCALAAASMTSAFLAGDLVGGIIHGVQMLADHARVPRTLHRESL